MDVDAIIRDLVATKKWSETSVRLCIRADFKCEYCGFEFLASPDAYKQIHFDHIVPRYAQGDDSFENQALACRTCNFNWKSRWNPQQGLRPGASREELIAICGQWIRDQRQRADADVQQVRRILGRP
jgi:5-methylcytosine-specific restriction endonuclease McrA